MSITILNSSCYLRFFCSMCLIFLFAFFFTSCTSYKIIVNGLDEKEANEILVFLAGKGITATKIQSVEGSSSGGATKVTLWDIQVTADQATEAMALLNRAGLPRRRGQSLLGIFTGGGLVPSELQEKIRYQAGLAEQIASTIRKIDGVIDAEVQISFPEEDIFNPGAKKQKITTSVYVKHNGVLDDPNAHLVTKIKRLVAASVPNLDYDNVTVIGDRVRYSGDEMTGALDQSEHVNIWSIILAKESVGRFRTIFFSFISLIFLLFSLLMWLLWKLLPLIRAHGGLKALFNFKPLEMTTAEKPAEEAIKEEKEEEKK